MNWIWRQTYNRHGYLLFGFFIPFWWVNRHLPFSLRFEAGRLPRYNYSAGLLIQFYRGQLRAFIASIRLDLWWWYVSMEARRRYW